MCLGRLLGDASPYHLIAVLPCNHFDEVNGCLGSSEDLFKCWVGQVAKSLDCFVRFDLDKAFQSANVECVFNRIAAPIRALPLIYKSIHYKFYS